MEISGEMQTQVLMASADIALRAGNYEESEKLYFAALSCSDESYGPRSVQSGAIYMYLAEISERLGKLDQSELFKCRVEAIQRSRERMHEAPALTDLIHSL